ncbi:MAG: hypothetical protein KDN22_33595 [Verrucomicrobiae bacterium]|nr:hypothetical protein [Verrucomicrobiae bacterium]
MENPQGWKSGATCYEAKSGSDWRGEPIMEWGHFDTGDIENIGLDRSMTSVSALRKKGQRVER